MTRENWRRAWRFARSRIPAPLMAYSVARSPTLGAVLALRNSPADPLQRPGTLPALWLPALDRLPRRQAAAFWHGWGAARRGDPLASCKHGPGDSRRGPWRWGWLAWVTARGRAAGSGC